MPQISVYGIKIDYEDWHAQKNETFAAHSLSDETQLPILFLHGWCQDKISMKPLALGLKALPTCRTRRFILIDMPGHGKSAKPHIDHSFVFMADIMTGFLKQLRIKGCHLIGEGFGGYIGVEMLHQHPDCAATITLINPPPLVLSADDKKPIQAIGAAMESGDFREIARTILQGSAPTEKEAAFYQANIDACLKAITRHVGTSNWLGLAEWAARPAFAKAISDAKLLCLADERPHPQLDKIKTVAPQATIGRTLFGGPFSHISEAHQFATMIDAFWRRID